MSYVREPELVDIAVGAAPPPPPTEASRVSGQLGVATTEPPAPAATEAPATESTSASASTPLDLGVEPLNA